MLKKLWMKLKNLKNKKMATNKRPSKKKRLAKAGEQTKWAPVWTVPKKYGKGRMVHPGRHTTKKRSWRRTNIKD